jgi:2-polyprenyl-3-methyl-5-hydroxy-6-metoxy-1,4-benzoquinol methylase
VIPSNPPQTFARASAYTTVRSDVFDMVPADALLILDAGCSNGALGWSLKQVTPNRCVWGIELDAEFAAEAAQHLDHVVHGDLNLLNWKQALGDRSFECIILSDVLEHLVDPERCLAQACSCLLPGGCVVVSLPNIRHVSALWAVFLTGHFPRRERGIFDGTHLRWFTLSDAETLLRNAGLHVRGVSQAMRWGDQGGGRINRLLNRLPNFLKSLGPIRELLTYQVCLRAYKVR